MIYDFNELKVGDDDGERKVMVDVGGGRGQAIMGVLKEYPDLPKNGMVLQDRAVVIDAVKKMGDLPAEVEKMVVDFTIEQPVKGPSLPYFPHYLTIKLRTDHLSGAKSYYLRRVLHDFSDEGCLKILKHVAAAMAPDSKLLISEMLVPSHPTDNDMR